MGGALRCLLPVVPAVKFPYPCFVPPPLSLSQDHTFQRSNQSLPVILFVTLDH
ncbi:hypothetical protein BC826DRAFT_1009075, partial [Russula brevipes]